VEGGRVILSGDQIYDHEDQGHDIGSNAKIIQGPDPSCLFPGQLFILIDVFDDGQPEPEDINLDPSLRDLMDDHHGEYDPEDHRHEC
jgi:hypothetical protein